MDRTDVKTYFESYRKYDLTKQDHKRKLINSFVERIILYDDRLIITFFNGDKNVEISLDTIEKIGKGTISEALSLTEDIGEPQTSYLMYGVYFYLLINI